MTTPIEIFFWVTPNGGMAAGAELRQPPPAPGSDEQREFARALFGHTAATVIEASSERAHTA